MPPLKKEYIGDGVYVEFTGQDFIITVSDGRYTTQTIYVVDDDAKKLTDYINRALEVNHG